MGLFLSFLGAFFRDSFGDYFVDNGLCGRLSGVFFGVFTLLFLNDAISKSFNDAANRSHAFDIINNLVSFRSDILPSGNDFLSLLCQMN